MVTYSDLQWLIDNEGFVLKDDFSAEDDDECPTKAQIIDALYVDETDLSSFGALQLVSGENITQGTIRTTFFRSVTSTVDNDCSPVTATAMYHNGTTDLPMVGYQIYTNPAEASWDGNNYYANAERYVGSGVSLRFRTNPSGVCTELYWCQDYSTTPYNLTTSAVGYTNFTISWDGGDLYQTPSHQVIVRHTNSVGTIYHQEVVNAKTLVVENTGLTPSTLWWVEVRAYRSSDGAYGYKTANTTVSTLTNYSIVLGHTDSAIAPCDPPSGSNTYWTTSATPVQGDYFYTDSDMTTPFNGSGEWHRDEELNVSFRIGTDGYISAKTTC